MSRTTRTIAGINEELKSFTANLKGISGMRARNILTEIADDLDRISGLDGIVADKMEELALRVHEATSIVGDRKTALNTLRTLAEDSHAVVEDIKQNYANANIFDYYGDVNLDFVD